MCKLDLTHLWIDLQIFTLNTHLPQPWFDISYRYPKRIHRKDVGEEEEEGTPATTAAKFLITTDEEALDIALDLQRERAQLGDGRFGFGR
jgi:hypothetical protein